MVVISPAVGADPWLAAAQVQHRAQPSHPLRQPSEEKRLVTPWAHFRTLGCPVGASTTVLRGCVPVPPALDECSGPLHSFPPRPYAAVSMSGETRVQGVSGQPVSHRGRARSADWSLADASDTCAYAPSATPVRIDGPRALGPPGSDRPVEHPGEQPVLPVSVSAGAGGMG